MDDWRATRPVDVARLNSGVFLAVLRKFAVVAAICAPVYFGAIVVLAEVRAPQLSIGFVLAHVWLYFLTAFVGHLALGLVIMTFCTAVGSLIWWRNVLARGGPNTVLAALASIAHRVVFRLAQRIDGGLLAVSAVRERMIPTGPDHTLLAQRCSAIEPKRHGGRDAPSARGERRRSSWLMSALSAAPVLRPSESVAALSSAPSNRPGNEPARI